MNMTYLYAALFIMFVVLLREFLRKRYNFDMDNIDLNKIKNLKSGLKKNNEQQVRNATGDKSIVLIDTGANKATVMATLRQITGFDYNTAKSMVDTVPSVVMSNISEAEADMNKKALEFVGAKVEIK